MKLETVIRPITLTDTEWDLLGLHHSPADRPSGEEAPDYSAALSRLLGGLSGAPAAIRGGHIGEPLKLAPRDRIVAHTDGACSGNPGPGGWGAVLVIRSTSGTARTHELSGSGRGETTNNRMELTAALRALQAVPQGSAIEIVTDSRYVVDGATSWVASWRRNGWKASKGRTVKNRDLWELLGGLTDTRKVTWRWVKGHAGIERQERADALARAGCMPGDQL